MSLHKDKQAAARVLLSVNKAAQAAMEADAIIRCYDDAQRQNGKAYMVKVESGEQVFLYPVATDRDIPDTEAIQGVLRHVHYQHTMYERPPITQPPSVFKVTPEIVRRLKGTFKELSNPSRGVCDFCAQPQGEGYRHYDAKDFMMLTGHISVGGWYACAACSKFVESADWDGLAQRMTQVNSEGVPPERMAYLLELNQQQLRDFRQHRICHKDLDLSDVKLSGKNPRGPDEEQKHRS